MKINVWLQNHFYPVVLCQKREHFAKIYPVLQNNSGKKQSKATEISKLQALSSRENDPFKRLAKWQD